jgi:hypothetical protein
MNDVVAQRDMAGAGAEVDEDAKRLIVFDNAPGDLVGRRKRAVGQAHAKRAAVDAVAAHVEPLRGAELKRALVIVGAREIVVLDQQSGDAGVGAADQMLLGAVGHRVADVHVIKPFAPDAVGPHLHAEIVVLNDDARRAAGRVDRIINVIELAIAHGKVVAGGIDAACRDATIAVLLDGPHRIEDDAFHQHVIGAGLHHDDG